MPGPYLRPPIEPMPASEQVESARTQLEWNQRDLEEATWAVHPVDLEELRSVIGDATSLHGLWFTVAADPELAGAGVRLVWRDEWPDNWE